MDEVNWARAQEPDFTIRCQFYRIFQDYIDRFRADPAKELWPTFLEQAKQKHHVSKS